MEKSNEDFLRDIEGMPFHCIDRAVFYEGKVLIVFRSGSRLEATAPNESQYKILRDEFVKNIGKERVIVHDLE